MKISWRFQHFLLENQCCFSSLFPLLPSAPFAVWVSVWVKPENPMQKLRSSNQRLQVAVIHYKSYDELPLFLNAATVAKVLGIAPSSSYELMHE